MTLDECRVETQKHIDKVRKYIRFFTDKLTSRGENHDASKMESPEVELFAEHTERLAEIDYGSDEYKKELEELQPALEHHYAVNRHHPQHFPDGINGMNIIDIVELIADWKASSERYNNGNLLKSIEINAKRFNMDEQLTQILMNTARMMDEHE